MKKLKEVSSNVGDLRRMIEEIAEELKRIYGNLIGVEDDVEEIEDDLDAIISAEEDNLYLNEKVWEKNNLDKIEFVSAILQISKEVYDNLPQDESFDFKIKISERRVKY